MRWYCWQGACDMRPEFVQTSMGIIGSLGFALLFGIRGTKPLGCIALGSGIGWIVYLVSVAGGARQSIWYAGIQPGHCRMQ